MRQVISTIQSYNSKEGYVSLKKVIDSIPELNGGMAVVYEVRLQRPCSEPVREYCNRLHNAFGIFQQMRRGLDSE